MEPDCQPEAFGSHRTRRLTLEYSDIDEKDDEEDEEDDLTHRARVGAAGSYGSDDDAACGYARPCRPVGGKLWRGGRPDGPRHEQPPPPGEGVRGRFQQPPSPAWAGWTAPSSRTCRFPRAWPGNPARSSSRSFRSCQLCGLASVWDVRREGVRSCWGQDQGDFRAIGSSDQALSGARPDALKGRYRFKLGSQPAPGPRPGGPIVRSSAPLAAARQKRPMAASAGLAFSRCHGIWTILGR